MMDTELTAMEQCRDSFCAKRDQVPNQINSDCMGSTVTGKTHMILRDRPCKMTAKLQEMSLQLLVIHSCAISKQT